MPAPLHPSKILILRALRQHGEQTSAQVSASMPGLTVKAIHAALVELARWGHVSRRTIKESSTPQLIFWKAR
jgi:DNA-binding HxlR family transcriptional regulator